MPTGQSSESDFKRHSAASAACTKAATFALLIALAQATLVWPWLGAKDDEAAYRYFGARLNLRAAVEGLPAAPAWQSYELDNPSADDQTLEMLSQAVHYQPPKSKSPTPLDPNPWGSMTQTKPGEIATTETIAAPSPPTSLSVGAPIGEIGEIVGYLLELDDLAMLIAAARSSNSLAASTGRWNRLRMNLVNQGTVRASGPNAAVVFVPEAIAPSDVSPSPMGKGLLLSSLRLKDVRELAKFELPEVSSPRVREAQGGMQVEIFSPGALPKSLGPATAISQCLLFAALTYFGAFARDASRTRGFPMPGTLFGVFAASSGTRCVFGLLLVAPSIAAIVVVAASGKPLQVLLVVPVIVATCWVMVVLHRGAFFSPRSETSLLRKRPIRAGKRY